MNAGKRDGRETADILRIHSVRFKYLVTLFVVIFLACGITYLVTFINIWGRMQQSAELQIQSVVDIFAGFMDRSGLTTRDIVDELRKRLDVVEVYERADELPGPFSGAALEPGKLEMRTVEGRFEGAVRMPDGYLYLSVTPTPGQFTGIRKLVLQTLFLCAAIASLGAVVAIHRAIRPLQKLNQAIRQVARGNFDVHVDFESRDEMGVVVRNFNWMVGELRNIEYLRKDFVSSVSHEFKTPIAAIQGSVKLLTSAPYGKLSEEKFQKYTRLISDETDRMASLSSNLLRLSRLENQSTAENPTVFSLDEQIRRCILLLENQWHARHIDLDIQLDRADYRGDEELVQQLWLNLLSNAIKFTGEGGNISVKLRRVVGGLRVEIADDGIGMSPETQQRIFEKFYQGDGSHSREGNGLGLSIVKRILDLHGGAIKYESAPGAGTTCTVTLPDR